MRRKIHAEDQFMNNFLNEIYVALYFVYVLSRLLLEVNFQEFMFYVF